MEILKEILAIAFLLISGIIMIVKPEIVWKVEHFLSVKDGEPTDLYIQYIRILGVVCILVAIIAEIVFSHIWKRINPIDKECL